MRVSDYIVNFFKEKGISHFFGYQGTMIAYFVDSIEKTPDVYNHVCYNEQGAAFAAVGYAKVHGTCAVAYATSGPGALNLVSGVADAYYDSVPVIFLTGQLNTNEYTEVKELRQQGFQETPVAKIMEPITKYTKMLKQPEEIGYELEKAWDIANSGRKGPVVLDIPMNIQKAEIDVDKMDAYVSNPVSYAIDAADVIISELEKAKRPVLLLGNGLNKDEESRQKIRAFVEKIKIPVITSLLGSDILSTDHPYNFGVIGAAYGHRYANLIMYQKADLIISLGCSMCRRQTGQNTEAFAKNAKIIRVDIDQIELRRKVHHDDVCLQADANQIIDELNKYTYTSDWKEWINICNYCKSKLIDFDNARPERLPNKIIRCMSRKFEETSVVTCDVGQHMMWSLQSIVVKNNHVLYSGGHGAMGFALPAAIGAYYKTKKRVYCIAGDGGFQMNIQELQWVARENLPITIIVMDNDALGLIHQQQQDFFHNVFIGANREGGYTSPDFRNVAKAYGIKAEQIQINDEEELSQKLDSFSFPENDEPFLLQICLSDNSLATPKTYFGQEMINQKPNISSELLEELILL